MLMVFICLIVCEGQSSGHFIQSISETVNLTDQDSPVTCFWNASYKILI